MDDLQTQFAELAPSVQTAAWLLLLGVAAVAVNYILKSVILKTLAPYLDQKTQTDDQAASWAATVVPLLIVARGIELVPDLTEEIRILVSHAAEAMIVVSITMAIVRALAYANERYERLPTSKNRPIKGFVQVAKILVLCGAAIIIVSVLIDESPLLLLSGLGAITAVLLLVFKDTILSLVASVQLSTNDMLRVGDWITMPSMNADGDVIDISLHTVKVQNFDKTIVTVPTHRLVSDSFANWRGMAESGGRRIKRSIILDQNSIRFLQDDEVAELKQIALLASYLTAKEVELEKWNAKAPGSKAAPANFRRLTNIGTFRAYVSAYLKAHPRIDENFTLLVRQLAPGPKGVPIELYCFTNTTAWQEYEAIQSDIFDHFMAIVPEFGLRGFQQPSGLDFSQAFSEPRSQ